MKRPGMELSTSRKAVFTLIAVLLFSGTVEGVARIVWWRLERDSLRTHYQKGEAVLANDAINFMKAPDGIYGYTLRPGFRNPGNTINSQGFRAPADFPIARSPESLRIVCLGESTTFGTNDESNYPVFLGRILDKTAIGYREYEVINAGVPGWLSDQIALRVQHQIADLKPDVAVLYVGWNDFQTYDPLRPVASKSSFEASFGGKPWMEYATHASRTLALLNGLGQRRPPEYTSEDYTDAAANSTPPERRYRFLLRNLGAIVQELRTASPSTRIFVSTLVGMWPQTTSDGKMVVPFWINEHHVSPDQAAHFVDELNEQLRRFAGERGVGLIDVATIFQPLDRQRLQFDFAHMYSDGYELMAWTMFDALVSSNIVKARSSGRQRELLSTYREAPSEVKSGGHP
ncbi:MAG TPA: SGNH/GDSL hydrolase family protein [Vicinamibacterales bacterium]|nr:SGNH/GDSL hydrolase family protein [Vicinamibacterales bacterium]